MGKPGESIPIRYGHVKRDWVGAGCFVICGGTSVTDSDLAKIREAQAMGRAKVLAVNSSYLRAPWADALVFADWKWWDDFEGNGHARRPEFLAFAGEKISAAVITEDRAVNLIRRVAHRGLQDNHRFLMAGVTTVSTALNVLTQKAAAWAGMLGLDGKPGPDDEHWHHEPHPKSWLGVDKKTAYRAHGAELAKLAPQLAARGLEVFNCNRASAHRMFPFASVDQLLGRAP